ARGVSGVADDMIFLLVVYFATMEEKYEIYPPKKRCGSPRGYFHFAIFRYAAFEIRAFLHSFCGNDFGNDVYSFEPKRGTKHIFYKAFFGLALGQNQNPFHQGRPPRIFFSHNSPRP
ncbi:MAG: hypothetical protein ONB41_09380, partial [candidate division KSB1 bacterium]|nr:hypothetical protein [candidate division KSB1 bacterium]